MRSGLAVALASLFGVVVGAWLFIYRQATRKRRLLRASRVPGPAAFAESLGRPECDPIVQAVYSALVGEAGDELSVVRADDDLEQLWGIVDEDLDDVALKAVEGLPASWSVDLAGYYRRGLTPRILVEFLEQRSRRGELPDR